MPAEFEFTLENQIEFQKTLDQLEKATNDFRIPFRLIAADFYRSQRIIFRLRSEGLYNPLGGFDYNRPSGFGTQTKRERAETLKERRTGRSWAPILFGETGDLKQSTVTRSHRYSIFELGRKNLIIGTSVPYGIYHQSDKPRTKLPQRKFIFIDGGPNDASRSSGITGRSERWRLIIENYIKQITTGRL